MASSYSFDFSKCCQQLYALFVEASLLEFETFDEMVFAECKLPAVPPPSASVTRDGDT